MIEVTVIYMVANLDEAEFLAGEAWSAGAESVTIIGSDSDEE